MSVVVDGDIDGLGISKVSALATVEFGGIYVQCDSVGTDPTAARELLARFTSIEGLRPRKQQHNVIFESDR